MSGPDRHCWQNGNRARDIGRYRQVLAARLRSHPSRMRRHSFGYGLRCEVQRNGQEFNCQPGDHTKGSGLGRRPGHCFNLIDFDSLILIRATCGDRHAVLNAIKTVGTGHDGTQRAGPTIVDGYPYQRD